MEITPATEENDPNRLLSSEGGASSFVFYLIVRLTKAQFQEIISLTREWMQEDE